MRKMRRIRAKLAASPESVTARSALGHSPLSDLGDSLQDMWDMMGSLMVCVRVTSVSGCVLVRARWWMDVDSNSARQYSSWPRQNRRPRVYAADADESKINAGWSFVASSSQAVVG
jgi:hypothetical protein